MRIHRSLSLACVALLGLAACGDDGGVSSGDVAASTTVAGATTTTSSAGATTTAGTTAAPTSSPDTTAAPTTVGPTTTPAPAPTPAPVSTAATTTVPGPTSLPTNTNLQPSTAITFTVPGGGDVCADFTPPGWVNESCQQFVAADNAYAFVQREAGDGHYRVVVLMPIGANDYESVYVAEEEGAGVWSAVTVVPGSFHFGQGPFNGDAQGLWVGYRYEGTGQYLDVDVIEWNEDGTTTRGALKGLDHGGVALRAGGADVRSAVYAGDDPGCCPSKALVQTISYRPSTNRWRIDAGSVVPIDDPSAAITSTL